MHQHKKIEYEVLHIPIDYDRNFLTLTKEEVKDYYNWFLKIKASRIHQLCCFLFENSVNCLTEKNLNEVEIFLLNSVSTVPKTEQQLNLELSKIPNHLRPFAKPDDYFFDNKTISICYDIGIFLGELIISLDNNIKWKLENDDEFSDYGVSAPKFRTV